MWISWQAAKALRTLIVVAALSMSLDFNSVHAHPPASLASSAALEAGCTDPRHDGAAIITHSHGTSEANGNTDCAHQFHPVLRVSAPLLIGATSDPVSAPDGSRLQQVHASFDPPPPRLSS